MSFAKMIVFTLAFFAFADLISRFVPKEMVAFRTREAAVLLRTSIGNYQPSLRLEKFNCFGDLANLGNFPQLRVFRHELFSSDACGNRNIPENLERTGTQILLWGDSFFAGDGNSDESLIGVQLEKLLHTFVYNAAAVQPEFMRAMTRRLRMDNGLLVIGILERLEYPASFVSEGLGPNDVCQELPPAFRKRRFKENLRSLIHTSPVKIWGQNLMKSLQDDDILPNVYAPNVFSRTLKNSDVFLFYPTEAPRYDKPVAALEYIRSMNLEAAKEGLRILVVLIPNKYTVYSPLFQNLPAEKDQGGHYLDELESRLISDGTPVLNLTSIERKAAAQAYREDRYLYWPDDTHWNPEGIRVAAEAISKKIASEGLLSIQKEH
ncbi:MAG: hypothetical protein A2X86_13060 [Bdellovibrionales bacterium GWA2_49_15]|nr:MAG: hypothetical protein A2X86_13060 [Bdellovibrionales bacterium GWA2_49_15]HAZ13452.1 hypothetical protein [Bdellovibrionales bacterium]